MIARKWRPSSFEELIGQSHVSQTLLNALKKDRLPHALLFTGPRGTGKTSTARILAKILRCPHVTESFIPCNQCTDCREIAAGNSVDVIEIDGASNNGVEAIRELRETVSYMPSSGKHKIYIIDEVHMLSTSAFNALLKTLEEPPEYITFMMATTEPHKIPNTILSRCQRFDLRRIPLKLIVEKLEKICQEDQVQYTEEALWMVARQGDGSLRDSESLLDQVITFCDHNLTAEQVIDVLGLTDRGLLLDCLKAIVERQSAHALNLLEKLFITGQDPKIFVQDLLEEIRHLVLVKLNPERASTLVDLPDSELNELKKLAQQVTPEEGHMIFDMALKGGSDLLKSQEPRIVLEMLILRMSSAPRLRDLLSLGSEITASPLPPTSFATVAPENSSMAPIVKEKDIIPEKPVTGLPNMVPNFEESEQSTPTKPLPHLPLEEKWHQLVKKIANINELMGTQLEHTFLSQLTDQHLTIGLPNQISFLHGKLTDNGFQKKLLNYINTFWGPGHSLEMSVVKEKKSENLTPKAVTQKKESEKMVKDRELVENHPLVKAAQKSFKTRIKNIREIK